MLSVVLSSYNYARYLPAAMDSVLSQTEKSREFIVVDDGSSDDSPAILESYARRHADGIAVLFHPARQNRGLAETLKLGFSRAAGEFIAVIESDDIWTPESLACRAAVLAQHPDVVVVHGGATMFGDPKIVRRRSNECRWMDFPSKKTTRQPYEALPYLLNGNITLTLSSVMIRRNALEGLDWNTTHDAWLDWWLMTQLSLRGRFYFEPQPVVRWRIHSESYNARYRSSIDEKNQARIYANQIRQLAEGSLYKPSLNISIGRKQILTRLLERSRKKAESRSVLAQLKKILPAPVKATAKKVYFSVEKFLLFCGMMI